MSKLVSFVFLCGMVSIATAACFFGGKSPESEAGEDSYCEYMGFKFREGSRFKTPDCYQCTCGPAGISCCGFGAAMVGVMGLPPFCEWKTNGCDIKAVLKADPTRECPLKR